MDTKQDSQAFTPVGDVRASTQSANGDRALAATLRAEDALGVSWIEQDVGEALLAERTVLRPHWLRRTDGQPLVYRDLAISMIGASESAKSWVAALVLYQAMMEWEQVVYVDFEASLEILLHRLRALGIGDDYISDHLHYIRPEEPLTGEARAYVEALLRRTAPGVVILDGVTEGHALHGWDMNSATDVAKWQKLVRSLFGGRTTIEIDHVGKDESRGAIGSQHKRAGIWQQVTFEKRRSFGYGKHGVIRLVDTKDRPGGLGPIGVNRVLGDLHLVDRSPEADGTDVDWWIEPPDKARADAVEEFDASPELMERISLFLESQPDGSRVGSNGIREHVRGKSAHLDAARRALEEHGYIDYIAGKGCSSLRPFRVGYDPAG